MPKFRTSHGSPSRKRKNPSFAFRTFLLIFVASGMILMVVYLLKKNPFGSKNLYKEEVFSSGDIKGTEYILPENRFYLPSSNTGEIVHHRYYSLSYNEKYEEAEWVAYVLTKESLKIPNVKRTNWFEDDPLVKTGSATYYDYKGSGFTRGHLAPAGDMAFNDEAMKESFIMSNITPQKRAFNNGIWKELEENIRNWAWKNNRLYIVTGPVLNKSIKRYIGKNKVGVPKYFYKVILDIDAPKRKGIGFIIPNERSIEPLVEYEVSIDSVEKMTNIDFFNELLTDDEEEKLESEFDPKKWKISNKLYQKRINDWNKQ